MGRKNNSAASHELNTALKSDVAIYVTSLLMSWARRPKRGCRGSDNVIQTNASLFQASWWAGHSAFFSGANFRCINKTRTSAK